MTAIKFEFCSAALRKSKTLRVGGREAALGTAQALLFGGNEMVCGKFGRCRHRWMRQSLPKIKPLLMLLLFATVSGVAIGGVHRESHPISITRASVYLTRESADVRIEVFLEDLYLFHQLKPNREDFLDLEVIRQGIELHEQFLAQRFELADVEGQRFKVENVVVGPYDLPAEGVPLSDLMGHQLVFDLQYIFDQPPEFLTFTQLFTNEESALPSETKLEVKQQGGGAVVEQTLMPHMPYSMRVNWDNPPLSPEASEEERGEWQQREKQSLLGITNYSRVYSFLYIDDFEVRHEILIPYLSLDEDLILARDEDSVLDLTEQDLARQQIEGYFSSGNPVWIDGQLRAPVVQRCDFYGLDMTDFAAPSKRRVVPVANARVALILSYRLDATPESIELKWNRFNGSVSSVSTSIIGQQKTQRKDLSRIGNGNILRWNRPEDWIVSKPILPVPAIRSTVTSNGFIVVISGVATFAALLTVVATILRRYRLALSIGCFGVVVALAFLLSGNGISVVTNLPVAKAESEEVFSRLHENIYRAIQRRTEESIYDGLATSVDGDLLRRIYLEMSEGLASEDDGGVMASLDSVERLQVDPRSVVNGPFGFSNEDVFGIDCSWRVLGRVEHWGHVHVRDVVYQAEFCVADVGEEWKLIEMEAFTQTSIDTKTQLAQ